MSAHYPVKLFKDQESVYNFKISLSNWSNDPMPEQIVKAAVDQAMHDAEFLRTHPALGKTYPEWNHMEVHIQPGVVRTFSKTP